ncbi:hypothetical protein ACFLWZ_00890 [Chloroflexota bacterium]
MPVWRANAKASLWISGIRISELTGLAPADIDKGVVRVIGKGDKERHALISEETELSIEPIASTIT